MLACELKFSIFHKTNCVGYIPNLASCVVVNAGENLPHSQTGIGQVHEMQYCM